MSFWNYIKTSNNKQNDMKTRPSAEEVKEVALVFSSTNLVFKFEVSEWPSVFWKWFWVDREWRKQEMTKEKRGNGRAGTNRWGGMLGNEKAITKSKWWEEIDKEYRRKALGLKESYKRKRKRGRVKGKMKENKGRSEEENVRK